VAIKTPVIIVIKPTTIPADIGSFKKRNPHNTPKNGIKKLLL
jgi:hypothetical protein